MIFKKNHPKKSEIDASIEWHNVHCIPDLIMNHDEIFKHALHHLKEDIYKTIFEREYVRTNFQKKILEMNVMERLEKKYTWAKNKAPYLYGLK